MATVIGKRVILAGGECPLSVEAKALEADIIGGMSVDMTATGLQKNANAATVKGVLPLIADKDSMKQKTVEDAWAINENMIALQPESGTFLNVLVATGNNITKVGTPLTVNGAGKFKIAAPATDNVYCYADEIVNLGADALVRVRFA